MSQCEYVDWRLKGSRSNLLIDHLYRTNRLQSSQTSTHSRGSHKSHMLSECLAYLIAFSRISEAKRPSTSTGRFVWANSSAGNRAATGGPRLIATTVF